MVDSKTFPCLACGAPVEPESGKTHMPCPYCGSNLAIPKALQRDAVPLGSTFKMPESKPTPEKEAADFLRKAQPVAIKAYNLYALWNWVRRFFPGCLVALLILACLCVAGVATIFSMQGG